MLPKNDADKLEEKRTNKSILNELQTRLKLLAQIIKRKMAFFGHASRNNKYDLVTTCILGMMPGKRRRGCPKSDQNGVQEVVQLERLTSELTTPTRVK